MKSLDRPIRPRSLFLSLARWAPTFFVAALLMATLAACGGDEPSTSPTAGGVSSTPAPEEPAATPGPSASGPDQGSVEMDREALVALYNATDGDNWTNNSNWLSDEPLSHWRGVETDDSGRVTDLDLPANELSGEIPAELGQLSNLTSLSLNNNQLSGRIPAELGDLSNLRTLALGYNHLSGEIPAELGQLSNLEWLHLGSNDLIGEIPAELGQLSNLIVLFLSNNQLSGCVPDPFIDVGTNDVDDLGLPFC